VSSRSEEPSRSPLAPHLRGEIATARLASEAEAIEVELLRNVARGDGGAFAELFDRYGARVLGLLVKMLGRRSDAEEVLQEAFLQVWQRAGDYRAERSSPKTWIFLLARSRALDRIRRRESSARRDQAIEITLAEATHPPGCDAVESRVVVERALQALTPEQRECVELSFFDGLSLSQIAQRLQIPLGTAKSRFLHGMRNLRETLGVRA
jgi:RNA polymerase sigma-70 factor (ECF subfamily)